MRVLVTIPHYFDASGGGHDSLAGDSRSRAWAVTQCLRSLHGVFGSAQEWWVRDGDRLHPVAANEATAVSLDVVICTAKERHLLHQVAVPRSAFRHEPTQAEPPLLGFECHAVLASALGQYDFYCYLEDDLVLHDPAFFAKLTAFGNAAGDGCVLLPNRYELAITPEQIKKVYIDFDLKSVEDGSAAAQADIVLGAPGRPVTLRRAVNPHAGCFFLNQAQMTRWAAQPHFLRRDTSFIGPLESAATLGLIRTFAVYKPVPRDANFLEIQHYGQRWSRKLPLVRLPDQRDPTPAPASSIPN